MPDYMYFFNVNDPYPIKAANITAESNRKLGEKLESISRDEVKASNRVDISLEEYERLKTENSKLKSENYQLELMFERIGIPSSIISCAIPRSVKRYENYDPMVCACVTFKVEFDVPIKDILNTVY